MTDFTEFLAWLLVFVIGCVLSFVLGVWVGSEARPVIEEDAIRRRDVEQIARESQK